MLLHQNPYLEKLKFDVSNRDIAKVSDGTSLLADEHKEFRSLLCSLLWVCQARIDLAHDVVSLQSEMVAPKTEHFRSVNALLKKTLANRVQNGLHLRVLGWPLRIVSIADSGHATKKSSYPYEGKMVLIMSDRVTGADDSEWLDSRTAGTMLSGYAHCIFFSARKAARISHSTSHAETSFSCRMRANFTVGISALH